MNKGAEGGSTRHIELEMLRTTGLPVVWADFLGQAAIVCFWECSHQPKITLPISGCFEQTYTLGWQQPEESVDIVRNGFADLQEATEYGACGVAIACLHAHKSLRVVRRSPKDGGGFDYFLAPPDWSGQLFQGTTRLEVSGILYSDDNAFKKRIKEKDVQLSKSDYLGLPGYVFVVEFGQPKAGVSER